MTVFVGFSLNVEYEVYVKTDVNVDVGIADWISVDREVVWIVSVDIAKPPLSIVSVVSMVSVRVSPVEAFAPRV